MGRTLIGLAVDQVLRVSMELGGNVPFVIFEDADIDAAVEGALLAKMRNLGEACTAANRRAAGAGVLWEARRATGGLKLWTGNGRRR